ncbi:hypothetical protein K3495_g5833 [Podosphaera aphanis]|nr:hypothetical protein K3495_g5833 [Podosphaera aphanis]
MIGLQVDDTLAHRNTICKQALVFNGTKISYKDTDIRIQQKGQIKAIELVNNNSPTAKDDYRKQRARGAYVASICQPEASYSLSAAAQHQDPTATEIDRLNDCLQWQINNHDRGLRFIPINLESAKLFVFVDASFANNKDLSS